MSAFNFGNGGIAIFSDNPQENAAGMGIRKTKMDDLQAKMPAKKRAALGTITNTSRVQPSRAAKQGAPAFGFGNENAQPQGKTFGGFNIHLDSESSCLPKPIMQSKPVPVLASRQPLSTLSTDEDIIEIEDSPLNGSPMVLDASLDCSRKEETPDQRFERLLAVPEYANDVHTYLRQFEKKHRPKPGYMRRQPDITIVMRSVLIDWLVEVAEEYKLHRETLCLAVNYIDRFLSHMSVLRGKLQLVGAASMFLASKFEEIYPPEVGEFVYITDDTYTKKQVLRMEHLILKVLSFDVAIPTFNCFIEKYLRDCNADDRARHLSFYIAELTLVEGDPYIKYMPSQIAAASICLANIALGQEPWPVSLQQKTEYSVADFQECMQDLYKTYCGAAEHPQQAIREKYKQEKYCQVSLISPPPSLMGLGQSTESDVQELS